MGTHDQRWQAVAAHVAEAMTARALSQADLADASGVSAYTVRRVMHGETGNYRPDRLRKISRALGWSADSIERILAGGEPEPMATATAEQEVEELRGIVDERVAELRADLDRALAAIEALAADNEALRAGLLSDSDERISSAQRQQAQRKARRAASAETPAPARRRA